MKRGRRTPRGKPRPIAVDLLADWRAFADPLPAPRSEHDWRYYGTVTVDSEAGALAWRCGGFGIGRGAVVAELDLWDRIAIDRALTFGDLPGRDGAPRFTPVADAVVP